MLTPRQAELLEFIRQYQADNFGISPTFQEMLAKTGLRSKAGIHRLLSGLEERGFITRRAHCARAIQINPHPEFMPRSTVRAAIASMIESHGPELTAVYLRGLIDDLFPTQSEAA